VVETLAAFVRGAAVSTPAAFDLLGVLVCEFEILVLVLVGFVLVESTPGAESVVQKWTGDAESRGFGAPATKSAAFESASAQPPFARRTAVVLLGAGAGPEPSKQLAVEP
jgi:hypothetical protein